MIRLDWRGHEKWQDTAEWRRRDTLVKESLRRSDNLFGRGSLDWRIYQKFKQKSKILVQARLF